MPANLGRIDGLRRNNQLGKLGHRIASFEEFSLLNDCERYKMPSDSQRRIVHTLTDLESRCEESCVAHVSSAEEWRLYTDLCGGYASDIDEQKGMWDWVHSFRLVQDAVRQSGELVLDYRKH